MTYSVMPLCETVVDLDPRPVCVWVGGGQRGGLNRVQHPDRQCTGQQNYVLALQANNEYSNMIVNQCGAGWGGFEGAGSWVMRNLGRGDNKWSGGGGAFLSRV